VSSVKTICITENSHLYENLNEKENIYIEVENIGECTFEIWTNEDKTSSRAVIKIDKKDFEKMIDAYRSKED
tara:strand:- start:531 stop:746 length:216 start_codon:yes stop_codon:yes gene_type:complete